MTPPPQKEPWPQTKAPSVRRELGHTRRAIDIHEGEEFDERAFKTLVREAVEINLTSLRK